MIHPDSMEWAEYLKGDLDTQRHQELQQHLEGCDACMSELAELREFHADLAEWKGPRLSLEAVESIKSAGYKAFQSSNASDRPAGRFVRRILTTAAIIMLTYLFQVLIWNPAQPVIAYTTTLTMVPANPDMSTSEAAASTTLYLTVHPTQLVSTPHLEGHYRLKNVAPALIEAGLGDRFENVFIMGSDPEQPVRYETDSLDDLQKALDIDSVEVGAGLMELQVHNRFIGQLLLRPAEPEYIEPPFMGMGPQRIILPDSTVAIARPGVSMVDGDQDDAEALEYLREPWHIVMGFINSTTISVNHAVMSLDDADGFIGSMHERIPELYFTILVPDSLRIQDTAFRLVRSVRERGIPGVSIKRVITP
ncbi:anti-sigma factor family protein [Gemmatimonadota bacterium]